MRHRPLRNLSIGNPRTSYDKGNVNVGIVSVFPTGCRRSDVLSIAPPLHPGTVAYDGRNVKSVIGRAGNVSVIQETFPIENVSKISDHFIYLLQ